MKNTIENKLQPLIGLELTRTTRAANMECLKFGFRERELRNGKIVNVGTYGLHLQCEWRIIQDNKMIIGSRDLYEPTVDNGWDENFDYEKGNLRDVKLGELIEKNNLIVKEIEADEIGGLTIMFSNNCSIQVIPLNTSNSEYNEYWRMLNNSEEEKEHFVIGRNEIEKSN